MKQTRKPNKPNNLVFINRDRGYRFVDRDPVMAEICTIVTDSGKTCEEISQLTSRASGSLKVAPSTIRNWLNGKTIRPQNYTVTWVGYVLGWKRGWTKIG